MWLNLDRTPFANLSKHSGKATECSQMERSLASVPSSRTYIFSFRGYQLTDLQGCFSSLHRDDFYLSDCAPTIGHNKRIISGIRAIGRYRQGKPPRPSVL